MRLQFEDLSFYGQKKVEEYINDKLRSKIVEEAGLYVDDHDLSLIVQQTLNDISDSWSTELLIESEIVPFFVKRRFLAWRKNV